MKLDLGAGPVSPDGFTPLGRINGTEIFPLDVPDDSVDEIRASHVLEHFGQTETVDVLRHWASKLKPGGTMKIAVPNFEWIAKNYLAGQPINVQGYTMGGQTDADDFHRTIFDDECLAEAMRLAGLIDIDRWESDIDDCARLPVSLNMKGTKPRPMAVEQPFRISAVMSVPRLGFMDNFFCGFEALAPMGVTLRRHTGAYWEACLERTLEATIREDAPDAILTIDYDTVFRRSDVEKLMQTMAENPHIDALAPIQIGRQVGQPLMTMDLPLGVKGHDRIPPGVFAADVIPARTAHFGLTLIRTSSLAKLPRPWLWSQPAPDGTWGEGRVDADIYFWRQWEKAGLSLYVANRVSVGHMELMVTWPGPSFEPLYQHPKDFQAGGPPKDVWK
jgi:hypothetical protein